MVLNESVAVFVLVRLDEFVAPTNRGREHARSPDLSNMGLRSVHSRVVGAAVANRMT